MDFFEVGSSTPNDQQKIALVDVDETICSYGKKRRYDLAIPIKKNINKINNLHKKGWKIIYWTARGSGRRERKSGIDFYTFTYGQLKSWGCLFDELITGSCKKYAKLHFDLVIDDKAKRIEEI